MKNVMKLLVLFLLLSPMCVFADERISYNDAKKAVKEAMKSYYIRGKNIQYNYAKTSYPIGEPEEATSQDLNYSVCAAYTYSVLNQAFGMSYDLDTNTPRYAVDVIERAATYYNNNVAQGKGKNKNFLLFYQRNTGEKVKYVYGDTDLKSTKNDLDTLINNLQSGDLLAYTGHALIVYDVLRNPKTGKKDALILNSKSNNKIGTRIDGTAAIFHNMFKSQYGDNGIIDVPEEGTVQYVWLSDLAYFVNQTNGALAGQLNCYSGSDECVVIRPFYNDNGKATFNYVINNDKYKKEVLRTKYPGLLIEKTVDKFDNNNVYVGDKLTYKIKITNKSSVDKQNVNYNAFYIEETLGSNVEYVSSNGEKISSNKIRWKVSSLSVNQSVELTYQVKVKNDTSLIGNTISATGNFYAANDSSVKITTGKVENKIIPKVTKRAKSYSDCYNQNKSNYSGLGLINAIYTCAYNQNFNFDKFTFGGLFTKDASSNPKVSSSITLNEQSQFRPMIYNDYLGGLVTLNNKFYLPRIPNKKTVRANTVYPEHFKEGDILIYEMSNSTVKKTTESGLYAYIYIGGKFVGVNGSGRAVRNTFTYDYYGSEQARHGVSNCASYGGPGVLCDYKNYLWEGYGKAGVNETILEFANHQTLFDKDNYVILRPELIIKEIISMDITVPSKKQYIQKKETLDLSGGFLILNYNDGSKSSPIALTNKDVKVTGFDNKRIGQNKITVEYKDFKINFNVEIVGKTVSKIKMKSNPTKRQYIEEGEALSLDGGVITVTYNDDSIENINLTNKDVRVMGFNNENVGKNTIVVEYKGKRTTFAVNIVAKEVTKLFIKRKPLKLKYIQNSENLDLTGGILNISYNNGKNEDVSLTNKNLKITGFDNKKLGFNKIIVEYEGMAARFDVEIVENKVSKIVMKSLPYKTKYNQNTEKLDLTGGVLKVTYGDNSTGEISLTNENVKVSGFDNSQIGQKTLIVEYKGKSTNFVIDIISKQVTKVEVTTKPINPTDIKNDEKLDLTGGVITVTYDDNSTDRISLTNEDVKIIKNVDIETGDEFIEIEYQQAKTKMDLENEKDFSESDEKSKIFWWILAFVLSGIGFVFLVILCVFIIRKKKKKKISSLVKFN